jgi:tRNA 2-thiouridine synthesizing protein B
MILHTVNIGPGGASFDDCLRTASHNDAILLMGDGVYAALEGTATCTRLRETGAEVFILEPDARAAGILKRLYKEARLEDIDGFVLLTERFPRQLAWY